MIIFSPKTCFNTKANFHLKYKLRIREDHSDNEDGGGGVTGGVGGGVDDDWANFDSFRKQETKPVQGKWSTFFCFFTVLILASQT